MNETAIVKFLANLIPQDEYIRGYATFFTGTDIPVSEFDPINLIEHVWMAVEVIHKLDQDEDNWGIVDKFEAYFESKHISDMTAKDFVIAAVRALATPEQQESWL